MQRALINKDRKISFFLSIKWRALLLVSLVLLTINAFFYHYHKNALLENFQSHREFVLQRNNAQIQGLLDQSAIYLQQVAELIPSLYGITKSFEEGNNSELVNIFASHWPELQIQTEIDSVGFIDKSGKLIHAWGDNRLVHPDNALQLANIMKNNIAHNQPSFQIFCFSNCKQYGVIPIIANGQRWGAISISRSLAEPIMSFTNSSSIDIGILSTLNKNQNSSTKIFNVLEEWQLNVIALSKYKKTISILNEAEKLYTLQQLFLTGGEFEFLGRSYEIQTHALDARGSALVVYLEDITDPLAIINNATKDTLITGILGVLFSELALLFILWTPLSNLRRTAEIIPLLATSNFKKARHAVLSSNNHSNIKDEIDILDESIINLSYQLETLESNVEDNSLALANKMDELTIERDFIRRLLNTAQVIIITQNTQGNIVLVNKQTEITTGYNKEDFIGKPFSSLLAEFDINDNPNITTSLNDIASGKSRTFKNEAKIRCKNNSQRYVTWLHSHIENQSENDPVILSVGLDITDQKSHEKKINWLADHDPLTGLLNRRRFNDTLHKALQLANRYHHQVGLLFLDLDNFKHINDTLGHQTGDSLIKSVADCLKIILRESDYIGRIGGDEFAIILPMTNIAHLIDVANKINDHLHSLRIPVISINHHTSASIGIAMYPEHANNSMDLLTNADLAMYQAKFHGKGCWHVFSKSDNAKERIEAQLFWHHKIVDALAHDKFELHFQPIMSVKNNLISHHEVLIRMRDENDKIVLPTPFIEVAEKTGLIHDIDHFVLRKSIQRIADELYTTQSAVLAVNLSAHSFADPQLLPLLKDLLISSKIDPSTIVFEITETAALSDITAAAQLIRDIRSLGCRFALDDFGVGFSSFYYLKELPVDFIKIDGTFIQHLPKNKNDQIIVKAITDIAREFGIQTIAEYVEDEQTLFLLKKLNVDFAQGYHVGRPSLQAA